MPVTPESIFSQFCLRKVTSSIMTTAVDPSKVSPSQAAGQAAIFRTLDPPSNASLLLPSTGGIDLSQTQKEDFQTALSPAGSLASQRPLQKDPNFWASDTLEGIICLVRSFGPISSICKANNCSFRQEIPFSELYHGYFQKLHHPFTICVTLGWQQTGCIKETQTGNQTQKATLSS